MDIFNSINGTTKHIGSHLNSAKKISFYVASNNQYFAQGVEEVLRKLQKQHSNTDIRLVLYEAFGKSAFLIPEKIKKTSPQHLSVIIAAPDLLNKIFLSMTSLQRERLLFVTLNECDISTLSDIISRPDKCLSPKQNYITNDVLPTLSNRERKICYYTFHGYTSKEIGIILGIDIKTVSGNRVSLMKKAGCNNRLSLFNKLNHYYGIYSEG